ncbi:type II secretion system protein N [Vibrio sp. Of7-15]|uniref:type II secretion system protein N n=1 Tax=Vibrio sp. Of7-15 TaxID=2724879 RepID=UPI001EF39FF0|nr:type II secretion system protein N [Vibrio sp. Of7-15]MCG7496782.1 type II secretion system protein N [Vibrio sp. Of7-15]
MKFKLLIGAVFTLFFSVSLLAHLPIKWVLEQVPKVPQLSLKGVSGTPWQGKAEQVSWQQHNAGQVSWELQLASLFTGKVEFKVRFGRGSDLNLRGKGVIGYDMNGPYGRDLLLSAPADKLLGLAKMPVPVSAQGQLELTLAQYRFVAPWCQVADGELVWSGAQVISPLGNINPGPVIADVNCTDNQLSVQSKQNSEALSSEFEVGLTPNMRYSVSGWFKPGAEFPAGLNSQLKWLGNPDPKGQYKITQSGRL